MNAKRLAAGRYEYRGRLIEKITRREQTVITYGLDRYGSASSRQVTVWEIVGFADDPDNGGYLGEYDTLAQAKRCVDDEVDLDIRNARGQGL